MGSEVLSSDAVGQVEAEGMPVEEAKEILPPNTAWLEAMCSLFPQENQGDLRQGCRALQVLAEEKAVLEEAEAVEEEAV